LDSGHGIGDLSSHELQTAERRLVVEQNAAASKDAIALTVVDRHPVGVELCHTIGTAGIERGQLVLGNRLCLPEHFRSTGLVEANTTVNYSDCLEQIESTDSGDLTGSDGLLVRHTDKALSGEVVDLLRLRPLQQADAGSEVGQVKLDQVQIRMIG